MDSDRSLFISPLLKLLRETLHRGRSLVVASPLSCHSLLSCRSRLRVTSRRRTPRHHSPYKERGERSETPLRSSLFDLSRENLRSYLSSHLNRVQSEGGKSGEFGVGIMSFVFRGSRSDIESGFSGFIPERRAVRMHAGGRPVNTNSMAFLLTVLLLFMILNSHQLSPNFLLWLVLGVFLLATGLRMYATCQQLQAQAQAHAAAASGLLGHTEFRLHVPPSIAFATRGRLQSLRLQLALLDREFDDLDYDALRALDADNSPDTPSMSEEEINALPVHKYKGPQCDGPSLQQASSSSASASEKKQELAKPDGNMRNPEDELTCSVCLEQVNSGELIRSLPCLHQFHTSCIDPWLRQQGTCPVCKHRASSGWHANGDGETDASFMV